MKTDADLEKQVRRTLRDALDRDWGPDPTWADSPAARRVAELERRAGYRRPLRILAVAALIGAVGGAALLGGALDEPPDVSRATLNGWIAFTANEGGDLDIWLVALDHDARRVVGTDTDQIDQLCPAFSPDGRSLAYGQSEAGASALVVADVSEDGVVSGPLTIDVGDGMPPPCPVWSPEGDEVVFGVPRTSPKNPGTSAAGSEVWVVSLADRGITVLPDLLATDLEWSPDGDLLAIASGEDDHIPGEILQDGLIHLFSPSSNAMRTLDGTLGVSQLTWSPDGQYIAFTGTDSTTPSAGDDGLGLRIIDIATERQRVLAAPFAAFHGIGPVWSPDGETIVYQRQCAGCSEAHEVVLVTPGDLSDESAVPSEVVIPAFQETGQGSGRDLSPFRVTWSPDGQYLLYLAWTVLGGTYPSAYFLNSVVAVPTDPDVPAVVLFETEFADPVPRSPFPILNDISPYDGYPDTTLVPIQTWGRVPSE